MEGDVVEETGGRKERRSEGDTSNNITAAMKQCPKKVALETWRHSFLVAYTQMLELIRFLHDNNLLRTEWQNETTLLFYRYTYTHVHTCDCMNMCTSIYNTV